MRTVGWETWSYLWGPLGVVVAVLVGVLLYVMWLDLCDNGDDDQ